MESESSHTAGGSRDKETYVQPIVEELQTQIEQLKAQIKTLTSAPPPNGVHGSSSQQQETPGGSAQPNGTSAPPLPRDPTSRIWRLISRQVSSVIPVTEGPSLRLFLSSLILPIFKCRTTCQNITRLPTRRITSVHFRF
ncbi:unnamed protein product [Linum trigynum]|uniref:Uncharacterized protein n=1 Tax=Linum trigynum TaxID=586398 RepID=A0AAV2E343_9ROSI